MTKQETNTIRDMIGALEESCDYLEGMVDGSGEDNGEGEKIKYFSRLIRKADKLLGKFNRGLKSKREKRENAK